MSGTFQRNRRLTDDWERGATFHMPSIVGPIRARRMPAFASVAWVREARTHRLAYVALDWEQDEFSLLQHREVIIDGARFRCIGLRTYFLGVHRKGDLVGLLVTDAASAANEGR
jgi:hypothetical protein